MNATITRPPTTARELAAARRREAALIERGEHHGIPRQLNHYVADVDSEATGYGAHCRLVVMGGLGEEHGLVTIREDVVPGLPESDGAQRRARAEGWQRMHPRGTTLTHVSSERYVGNYPIPGTDGTCIEHIYTWLPHHLNGAAVVVHGVILSDLLANGPATLAGIAERTGRRVDHVARGLASLRNAGQVEHTGHGWQLTRTR